MQVTIVIALHYWVHGSAVPVLSCKFLASMCSQVHVRSQATIGVRPYDVTPCQLRVLRAGQCKQAAGELCIRHKEGRK